MKPSSRTYLFFLLLTLTLGSCGNSKNSRDEKQGIIIFAASSLTEPLTALKDRFLEGYPNATIDLSTASSAQLARQISHGAPAALFISANQFWVQDLMAKGLINTPKHIASNQLVLAVSSSMPTDMRIMLDDVSFLKTLPHQALAIADPALSPLGLYTKEMLEKMDVWQTVVPKAVLAPNAMRTRFFVETGQTEFAILYHSDTIKNPRLKSFLTFLEPNNPKVSYWAAVNESYKNDKIVQAFFSFLTSEMAQEIFTTYGFLPQNETLSINP